MVVAYPRNFINIFATELLNDSNHFTFVLRTVEKTRYILDEQNSLLMEAIKSSPKGTFKLFKATEDEPEVERAIENRGELSNRIEIARANNCLIEVISLRIQYMDLWLRVYFENVPPHGNVRQQEFGRLLRQCFELGLEKSLYDAILKFNKDRVNAIHGYLLGLTSYSVLDKVVEESDGLSERLAEFVVNNSGKIITQEFVGQHVNRGDTIYNIPSLLHNLRSRKLI